MSGEIQDPNHSNIAIDFFFKVLLISFSSAGRGFYPPQRHWGEIYLWENI